MTEETTGRPVPSPSQVARPAPAAAPHPTTDRSGELARARSHGFADVDGTVHVKVDGTDRVVGQYPDKTPDKALDYFAHKYLDLVDAADLLIQRLQSGADGAVIAESARKQREALAEAKVVGDLATLGETLDAVVEAAGKAVEKQSEATEAARQQGLAERTAIVERAEEIAGADPARVQWKNSGQEMRDLFDSWKKLQATRPRLSKKVDDELWGRFSKARNTFDKHRREFFANLDKRSQEGKRIKQKLVERAEALSTSTDWRDTAAAYRDLMTEWKAAPRAGRKDDDALWAKFRAAQDVFFNARTRANEEIDAEYSENLVAKEALLSEAQALLPISDIDATKAKLRVIQEKWEEAGKVPRADVSRMEGGLREVEKALAKAEDDQWKRTNPENQARTTGVLAQLEESLAALEADLAKAETTGDAKRIAKAQEALETRRAWYDQVARTAQELSE